MKKLFLAIFFLISISFTAFCDNFDISNTTWDIVLDGMCIAEPVETSFGFVTYTDGKTLSAFSHSGKLLWERQLKSNGKVSISVLDEDFLLCLVNNSNKIMVFNSSGTLLWEKNLNFQIVTAPLEGRDGRFFLAGKNEVICFSITGLLKWHTVFNENSKGKLTEISLPLCELNDGSFLVYLEKNEESKTTALRISPFGEILELITFSGLIKYADYNPNGVYVSFSDGTSGLFAIHNGNYEKQYVIYGQDYSSSKQKRIVTDRYGIENAVCLSGEKKSINVHLFNQNTGYVTDTIQIPNIKFEEVLNCTLFSNYIFICDSKHGYLYDLDGTLIREDKFPSFSGSNKLLYLFFTKDGNLIFCKKNWSFDAYKLIQIRQTPEIKALDYSSWYEIDRSLFNSTDISGFEGALFEEKRIIELKNGDLGKNEVEYYSVLKSFTQAYLEDLSLGNSGGRVTVSVFKRDAENTTTALSELPLFVTKESTELLSKVIRRTDNNVILYSLLKTYKNYGWDPDSNVISQFEKIVETYDPRYENVFLELCDCTVSICRFMGRPAFNQNGKNLLSKLLYPKYGKKVNEKARNSLIEIKNLGM